ncbi:MAG: tyrosine-type recombinase/integrase [Candidatus Delongbacteria bacterium]|nr:tyrosine-type recombinase/integrase [bacterium]MBL7034088.1 tyrosine-type recombinase/integrase [Candidatus Delongbacteria bacterium]
MTDHSVLVANFLDYLRYEKRFSKHTLTAYRRDLERFLLWSAQRGEDPANTDCIRNYLAGLLQQGLQRSTVARRLAAIKSYFRFLYQRELLPDNPAATVTPIRERRRLPHYLTTGEMRELLDGAPRDTFFHSRDRAILEIFYSTGLRLAELTSLQLEDIYRQALRVTGKGGGERVVPLGKEALAALGDYLPARATHLAAQAGSTDAVFINRFGRPLSCRWIQKMVSQRLYEISGRRHLSPHTLRHTFATHMLDNGADILAIKELLGHASLSTTQLYTHLSRHKLSEVYRKTHPRS